MSRKNIAVLIGMLLLGGGIFAYELRSVRLSQLLREIYRLNPWWLLAAAGCMALYWVMEALVVKLLLKGRVERFSFKNALRIPLVEQLFNSLTPFSSGGQPAQLVALMQSGVDGGRASSLLLMKFIVFQAMVLLNFILTLVFGFKLVAAKFTYLAWLVVFGFIIHLVVITTLLLIMYWYNFTKALVRLLLRPLHWFMKAERVTKLALTLNQKIDNFHRESLRIKNQTGMLIKASLLTFIQLVFYYSVPYFVLLALGLHPNFFEVLVMHIMIVMIISLFPIPGGSGGAEISFRALFATFVAVNSKLVLAMILWRIMTYYLGMFIGMFALVIKPDRVKEIDQS
ncbi:lysylphosphatidylglycerol synthase transmembrane domain-containing protein [Loigolactobacillus zhaoyuanensis]|uniref:lysylphosphatidylglycerol synthase transmembrane domain-containing protein n=1 Tax=Loigolactobacillus zhaoyuanensis TaxID=2486017 RepID=UPI000F736492|nr:lysylphosphatidylglycerol synthase transmembrane domain-containing protein [Loigolactobacillus zhaoyuanensis]